MSKKAFTDAQTVADVKEIAIACCYNHGSKVVDHILKDYDLVRKRSFVRETPS